MTSEDVLEALPDDHHHDPPRFRVAPKIAYDAEHHDWAVGLPVYLFGNSGGLTGGVRVDWDSRKDHDLLVGVFLTKTFSISDGL